MIPPKLSYHSECSAIVQVASGNFEKKCDKNQQKEIKPKIGQQRIVRSKTIYAIHSHSLLILSQSFVIAVGIVEIDQ